MSDLYWHCDCGESEPAQSDYELGDSEPCTECEDGTARVVTLSEAALWNQAQCLGFHRPFTAVEVLRVLGEREAPVVTMEAACMEVLALRVRVAEQAKELERLKKDLVYATKSASTHVPAVSNPFTARGPE